MLTVRIGKSVTLPSSHPKSAVGHFQLLTGNLIFILHISENIVVLVMENISEICIDFSTELIEWKW